MTPTPRHWSSCIFHAVLLQRAMPWGVPSPSRQAIIFNYGISSSDNLFDRSSLNRMNPTASRGAVPRGITARCLGGLRTVMAREAPTPD
ncbi:hypothetical protein B0I37DRAFT_370756 [Chaetomium sp. MPI-CAGE-AT-0009]|nr:hypothetical protein B0I37DRAFT_370756 [Chaetomium sp. MPI-CAGE-AT-0009]